MPNLDIYKTITDKDITDITLILNTNQFKYEMCILKNLLYDMIQYYILTEIKAGL